MKKLIYCTLIMLLYIACGDQEVAQYDAFNDTALIKFESNASNLEVIIDNQGTVEIPVSVSTYSNEDRTITVGVKPFPDGTIDVAEPSQYSFNKTVIIPANELTGKLILTGIDDGINEGENLKLQLSIVDASFDNFSIVDQVHSVNIFQICPISSDFMVGTYVLSSPIANIWCSNPRPSFIGDGVEVEVSIGESNTQRVFEAKYAPGSCEGFNGPYKFTISLACGNATLASPVNTGVRCSDVAFITIDTNFNNPSTYDINDDSQLTINVIDDINGSCTACCGAPFTNQRFTLTKI